MQNFEIIQPTAIVFGKDQWGKLASYIQKFTSSKRILITFGGGSIKLNGVYHNILKELKDFELLEFGGIEANPEFSTLMKAVDLVKREKIDFILAVGGGSVIDGTKFIVGAAKYDGDPWDVLLRKEGKIFTDSLPFACVLTLPATGSESNSGAVVSRSELNEKRTMGGPLFFPKFAFMDPTVVASLPKKQIANGLVDAYMHTMEQYLNFAGENLLQERYAEGILATLVEIGPKVMDNPGDYELAAQFMYCANQALNGTLRCGVSTDWATHMIGHELTAFYGIDHARTLAIIAPRLYEHLFDQKKEKLVQYGRRIWHIDGNESEIGRKAIEKTENFFQTLGIDTRISSYTTDHSTFANDVKLRFEERGWDGLGEGKNISPTDVEKIIESAI